MDKPYYLIICGTSEAISDTNSVGDGVGPAALVTAAHRALQIAHNIAENALLHLRLPMSGR
jgi:hypothetical protein